MNMEKIIIVGGGASGIFSALILSKKHKDVSIEIIEKESKLGRKLRATGNGHANLLNHNIDLSSYNCNSDLFSQIISSFSIDDLIQQYNDFGIPLTRVGDLYYPLSYNAPSFVNELEKKLAFGNVVVSLNTRVLDYRREGNKIVVETDKGNKVCDKLIITNGGASSPKLGSDGSFLSVLINKGYSGTSFQPGLTPIRTKERIIKPLVGVRHKAYLTLTDGYGPVVYSEQGEYLYKKDGISGICVMNISSKIKWLKLRRPLIHIDLFPGLDVSKYLSSHSQNEAVLESSLYSEVLYQSRCRGIDFNEAVHDLIYSYDGSYGFEDSQVSIGGIKGDRLNSNLSSKIEKDVYFAGEILDIDGLCGGFNLAWCLMSSIIVCRSI